MNPRGWLMNFIQYESPHYLDASFWIPAFGSKHLASWIPKFVTHKLIVQFQDFGSPKRVQRLNWPKLAFNLNSSACDLTRLCDWSCRCARLSGRLCSACPSWAAFGRIAGWWQTLEWLPMIVSDRKCHSKWSHFQRIALFKMNNQFKLTI